MIYSTLPSFDDGNQHFVIGLDPAKGEAKVLAIAIDRVQAVRIRDALTLADEVQESEQRERLAALNAQS